MRKRIIADVEKATDDLHPDWLSLEDLAEVELSSEDPAHPIESALRSDGTAGWRAAAPGHQKVRLRFHSPQRLRRIRMHFSEASTPRTQEYVLRWSSDGGRSFKDIVRQQWTFSPPGTTHETEDHQIDLPAVTVLELSIVPDISGGPALASLAQLRLA